MEEGQVVTWHSVNRVQRGIIIGKLYRKKDNVFLGYLVQMENGKKSIVHPKSIIHAETAK